MTTVDKLLTVLLVIVAVFLSMWRIERIADDAEAECVKIGAVAARTTEGYTCVERA